MFDPEVYEAHLYPCEEQITCKIAIIIQRGVFGKDSLIRI